MLAGQVAGYFETYEGDFTFATVHGAGHMAPQFKPPQTYKLIFSWLQEKNEFTKAWIALDWVSIKIANLISNTQILLSIYLF